jgi:hypothetical protein
MSTFVSKIVNLVSSAIRAARTSPWATTAAVAIIAVLLLRVMR